MNYLLELYGSFVCISPHEKGIARNDSALLSCPVVGMLQDGLKEEIPTFGMQEAISFLVPTPVLWTASSRRCNRGLTPFLSFGRPGTGPPLLFHLPSVMLSKHALVNDFLGKCIFSQERGVKLMINDSQWTTDEEYNYFVSMRDEEKDTSMAIRYIEPRLTSI